jgi:hypothetical protein
VFFTSHCILSAVPLALVYSQGIVTTWKPAISMSPVLTQDSPDVAPVKANPAASVVASQMADAVALWLESEGSERHEGEERCGYDKGFLHCVPPVNTVHEKRLRINLVLRS